MAIQVLKKTDLYSLTGRGDAKPIAVVEPCNANLDIHILGQHGICHEPPEYTDRHVIWSPGSLPHLPRTCHPMVIQSTKQEKGTHSRPRVGARNG